MASGTPSIQPLVLNRTYQVGGITLVVEAYEAKVDPASVPVAPDDRVSGEHFVHMTCRIGNTGSADRDIETRLNGSVSSGGIAATSDIPPIVVDGTDLYGVSRPVVETADLVRAGSNVHRSIYSQVPAGLDQASFYLNVWSPGSNVIDNTPPLFQLNVSG